MSHARKEISDKLKNAEELLEATLEARGEADRAVTEAEEMLRERSRGDVAREAGSTSSPRGRTKERNVPHR